MKNQLNKKINYELESLETLKKEKIYALEDELHQYAITKRNVKFFSKEAIERKIISKKARTQKRKQQVEKSFDQAKSKLQNFKQNTGLFFIMKPFRKVGSINLLNTVLKIVNENKLMIVIFLMAIIAGIIKPVFYSKYNILVNILKSNVIIGIMSIGMTFVIITGGIDLSVGSILGLTGIVSMGLLLGGIPTFLAFLIGFIIALLIGLVQGLLIAWMNLPPFIVTLVGLLSIRGVTYIYAGGKPKTDIGNSVFDVINNKEFLGIPMIVIILLILVFIAMFVLKFTTFGRKVYSVGGNVEAAKLSGINTKRIILICYAISGLMAGIGALAYAAKISSVGPTAGNAMELDVIAAVVLGGTTLSGGKGGVGKTFLGWLVISILGNALILLGFDSNYQLVFKGLVILLAIILDKDLQLISRFKKVKNIIF